jgi:DNA-binding MarR family transcriptional regulator
MHATVASAQELAESLQALWGLVAKTGSSSFFQEVADADVSLTQLKALHALADGNDLSGKQLAAALQISEAAASRAADGLVRRGFLTRHDCADDRRSRRLALTPEGVVVRDRLMNARLAGLVDFVEGLTPDEQAALAAALSPIVRRLSSP